MRGKKYFSRMLSTLCAVLITSVFVTVPAEAAQFDPAFYGAAYPDVAAAYGTDEQALLNHYLTYGMAEGRFPAADAQPGEAVDAAAGASGSGAAAACDHCQAERRSHDLRQCFFSSHGHSPLSYCFISSILPFFDVSYLLYPM